MPGAKGMPKGRTPLRVKSSSLTFGKSQPFKRA